MAQQQHKTVNFSEHQRTRLSNTDVVVTLTESRIGRSIPVYACASPFVADDTTLQNIIDNIATLTPQPISVIIDERTHEQTPDLMWSIQAYCSHYDNSMSLDTMLIAQAQIKAGALDDAQDVVVVIGSAQLLKSVVDTTLHLPEKTLIYVPADIEDQFALHHLLTIEQHCTIIPIISKDILDVTDADRSLSAVLKLVDLDMAQNAEHIHWLEKNADKLANVKGDERLDLLSRYLSVASNHNRTLLGNQTDAINLIKATAEHLSVADAKATLIAIKTHAMVSAGFLRKGLDTRVNRLLLMLGCDLYLEHVYGKFASLAQCLAASDKAAVLANADTESSVTTLSASEYKAAITWVCQQHTH